MTYTEMIVHDNQTTNYNRLVVISNKTRIVDVINPTKAEIKIYNAKYPLASATFVNPSEIRFYI